MPFRMKKKFVFNLSTGEVVFDMRSREVVILTRICFFLFIGSRSSYLVIVYYLSCEIVYCLSCDPLVHLVTLETTF